MASARGSSEDVLAYEEKRLATIGSNKRKLDSLNIPTMNNVAPKVHTKKRRRRTHNTSAVATSGHNLHARPQRNCAEKKRKAAATEGDYLRTRPQRKRVEKNTNEHNGDDG